MPNTGIHIDPQVRDVIALYREILDNAFSATPIAKQLGLLAERLADAHRAGNAAVCFQIASWHPALTGADDDHILNARFGTDDARQTVAREHGFSDWPGVEAQADRRHDAGFEHAVDMLLAGDLDGLTEHLTRSPGLVAARSSYGHRATLLHYAASNGVESYRQVVPLNLQELVRLLLASGADPGSTADIYGGIAFRELFESSRHPGEAGVRAAVLTVLNGRSSQNAG